MSTILRDLEFHRELIRLMRAYGIELGKQSTVAMESPPATIGIFGARDGDYEDWQPDTTYIINTILRHEGNLCFVKQPSLVSSAVYPPFSVGTEALYGARPVPNVKGIYPYVYNMKVDVGMKVEYDGNVYECTQAINELLYTPDQVPALFDPSKVVPVEEE